MVIREDDLLDPRARDLVTLHLAGMGDEVPPGAVFLSLSDLQSAVVTAWTVWDGDRIAGIGALKRLPDGSGEIKSMRTHPDFLGRGVGRLILETIVTAAKERGLIRLSLETGGGDAFAAAQTLYGWFGFRDGEPYAGYAKTDFNRFLHLDLT